MNYENYERTQRFSLGLEALVLASASAWASNIGLGLASISVSYYVIGYFSD